MLVTFARFQEFPLWVRGWLKAEAPLNICSMVVTAAVSQEDISWLKASANLNIWSILVTKEVFQEDMLLLKSSAS